jgi:AcrR family transcriptional regulator
MGRPAKSVAAIRPPGAAENSDGAKVSTQQRVLDASITLFNLYGIEAVSIQQISEALNISPGNLTYHYNKKADLVAEHLSILENQLNQGMRDYPSSQDPHVQVLAFTDLLRQTLRYRFLFVGANFILQNELVEPSRYAILIAHTKRSFTAQIRRLTAAKLLRPMSPPHSIAMLVNSIWTVWLGTVLEAQIVPAAVRPNEDMLILDIAIPILFIIHPYTDKLFFDAVYAELLALRRQSIAKLQGSRTKLPAK